MVRNPRQARVNGGRSHDSLKVASALTVKVNGDSHKRCSTQRRPDQHLRATLQVPRVRLPAGSRRSSSSFWCPIRSSSRRGRCCSTKASLVTVLLTRHSTACRSKVWVVEGATCTAAHWSGSRSEATRVLVFFFPLLFFFLLFRPLSQVDRRKTQLELEWPPVPKKRYWTVPKSCGSRRSGRSARRSGPSVFLPWLSTRTFSAMAAGQQEGGAPTARRLRCAHSRSAREVWPRQRGRRPDFSACDAAHLRQSGRAAWHDAQIRHTVDPAISFAARVSGIAPHQEGPRKRRTPSCWTCTLTSSDCD